MVSAREEVLARIRSALGGAPRAPLEVPRTYHVAGAPAPDRPALVALLAGRLEDYRAGVRVAHHRDAAAAVGEALTAGLARRHDPAPRGTRPRLAVPAGLDRQWLTAVAGGADVLDGDGLDAAALDRCDAVVTGATVAIAETGTIVLDGAPDQGRRLLTLLPDVHVCVVRDDQVVPGVPDSLAVLDPARPLTWISGPSATSDIELDRVEGVHGPRTLEVVILSGTALA